MNNLFKNFQSLRNTEKTLSIKELEISLDLSLNFYQSYGFKNDYLFSISTLNEKQNEVTIVYGGTVELNKKKILSQLSNFFDS